MFEYKLTIGYKYLDSGFIDGFVITINDHAYSDPDAADALDIDIDKYLIILKNCNAIGYDGLLYFSSVYDILEAIESICVVLKLGGKNINVNYILQ